MSNEVTDRLQAIRKSQQEALAGSGAVSYVSWLVDQVERYRRALQEIGNEYIISVDETLREIDKPAYPEQNLRIAQIRGSALEAISETILDLEEDELFEPLEEDNDKD